MKKNIPINKGNYSLDTFEREEIFTKNRASGVETKYYQNRKEWIEYPKSYHIAEYPLLVDLELSSTCNLKCPFCYTISEEFKKKVKVCLMDYELYKKIIDEIADKVFAIRLSLRGEPMIHPRFADAVKYAKMKGIGEVSTLTNGSKLTEDFFIEIMNAGIDWITVSFDGLYEEYEKNRYPLKFDVVYNRLMRIKEIKKQYDKVKPVIKVQTIWPAIEKNTTEYYKKMAVVSDLVAFNPLIDFSHPKPYNEIKFEDNFACPQLYQRLVIGADGLAMMCSNDEEGEYIIGDANCDTVYNLWHGEKLNDVRETHKKKNGFKHINVCRKCYLPRKTHEDIFEVSERSLIVRNYV